MKNKVTIVGSGNVGASLAQLIAFHGISDIVLYDITEGMPQGKSLDISEACPLWHSASSITGTNDLKDISASDIVVITAGIARKPGMSRDDLLSFNADVIREVSSGIAKLCPEAIVVVVTNPMDVMAQLSRAVTGFHHARVMGMGGILDSVRFRTFVAWELNVTPAVVEALVLGGHGDQMVPLPAYTTVRGIPITELISKNRIDSIIERTRNGGAEVVSLLKTGSAYYAPAAATFQMIKAILFDENCLLPAAAYVDGEFGVSGVYVGVPVVLGREGIRKIVEVPLSKNEKEEFHKSANAVKELVSKTGL